MGQIAVGAAEKPVVVGLGEVKVSVSADEVLTCLGLGSCICVAAFDPVRKAGGMAHIVLPESPPLNGAVPNPKFANVAVPKLLADLEGIGALRSRLVVRIAGGAHMMQLWKKDAATLQIGERNIAATKAALHAAGVRIVAEETGGSNGRTVRLWAESGKVTVAGVGQVPKIL